MNGLLRRIALTWLAVELAAGLLALAVLVALGPLVAVLLTRPEEPFLALAAVLPVSISTAALLVLPALRISRDLTAPRRNTGTASAGTRSAALDDR